MVQISPQVQLEEQQKTSRSMAYYQNTSVFDMNMQYESTCGYGEGPMMWTKDGYQCSNKVYTNDSIVELYSNTANPSRPSNFSSNPDLIYLYSATNKIMVYQNHVYVLNTTTNASWDWSDSISTSGFSNNQGFPVNTYEKTAIVDSATGDFILGSLTATGSSQCSGSSCSCTFYRAHTAVTSDGHFNWSSSKIDFTNYRNCANFSPSQGYDDEILFSSGGVVFAGTKFCPSTGCSFQFYYPNNGTVEHTYSGNKFSHIVTVLDQSNVKFYFRGSGTQIDEVMITPNNQFAESSFTPSITYPSTNRWSADGGADNIIPTELYHDGTWYDLPNNATQSYTPSGWNVGNIHRHLDHTYPLLIRSSSGQVWSVDYDDDNYGRYSDVFPTVYSQHADTDGDGYGDNGVGFEGDICPFVSGNSTMDYFGCPDNDGDGYSYITDVFSTIKSQWNDTDGDGYGDNLSGYQGDDCPSVSGLSFRNNTYGCVDSDLDGWANTDDAFPTESSQWSDSDGDGFGDEFSGYQGDNCRTVVGNSTIDRFGCLDADGDGYSNIGDAFDNNPTQYLDSDGDGYGNNQSTGATQSDAFPSDGTQWVDADGDGHGDNKYGSQGDHFPNDATRWQDSDEDGYANPDDAFDNDATQWNDTDGDGYGDNSNGQHCGFIPERFLRMVRC